jgi:glycosyltransferase involved in cell wall biosynthesis
MMGKNPMVSVIMNCYNSDKYLSTAIESVLDQTYTDWELIFWDNQSTDQSAQIVKSYQEPRIKYFYAPKHTSLGEARNLAIEKATGEWVAILDADDIWHPEKLEAAFEALEKHPQKEKVSLIYSKTEYIDANDNTFGYFKEHYEGDIHDKLIQHGDFIFISAAIFRADILRAVGKIDTSLHYAEDYDVLLKVSKNHLTICVDEYHLKYRVHPDNLTSTKVYEYDVENYEFLQSYAKEHNLSAKLRMHIFLNNSKRMTASIVKLVSRKDFKSTRRMIRGYPQYLLLSPFYVPYFIARKVLGISQS